MSEERVFRLPKHAGPDATVTTPAAEHDTCAGTAMEFWTEDGIFANSPRGDLQHDDVEDGKTPAYFTTLDNAGLHEDDKPPRHQSGYERRPATIVKATRSDGRIVSVIARVEDTGDEIVCDYNSERDGLFVRPGQDEPNLGRHGRCYRIYIGERRIHGRDLR